MQRGPGKWRWWRWPEWSESARSWDSACMLTSPAASSPSPWYLYFFSNQMTLLWIQSQCSRLVLHQVPDPISPSGANLEIIVISSSINQKLDSLMPNIPFQWENHWIRWIIQPSLTWIPSPPAKQVTSVTPAIKGHGKILQAKRSIKCNLRDT